MPVAIVESEAISATVDAIRFVYRTIESLWPYSSSQLI